MPSLISLAWQLGISLVAFIVVGALVEAMRRRGFDPMARLAALISPDLGSPSYLDPESF